MTTRLRCGSCGVALSAPVGASSRTAHCPRCGHCLRIRARRADGGGSNPARANDRASSRGGALSLEGLFAQRRDERARQAGRGRRLRFTGLCMLLSGAAISSSSYYIHTTASFPWDMRYGIAFWAAVGAVGLVLLLRD